MTKHDRAIGDWGLITFYFLLIIGGCEMSLDRKQQFLLRDILFVNKYKGGNLRQLLQKATD